MYLLRAASWIWDEDSFFPLLLPQPTWGAFLFPSFSLQHHQSCVLVGLWDRVVLVAVVSCSDSGKAVTARRQGVTARKEKASTSWLCDGRNLHLPYCVLQVVLHGRTDSLLSPLSSECIPQPLHSCLLALKLKYSQFFKVCQKSKAVKPCYSLSFLSTCLHASTTSLQFPEVLVAIPPQV